MHPSFLDAQGRAATACLLLTAMAAGPKEEGPACSRAESCWGLGAVFQGRPVSPRSTVPGFSRVNFAFLCPRSGAPTAVTCT